MILKKIILSFFSISVFTIIQAQSTYKGFSVLDTTEQSSEYVERIYIWGAIETEDLFVFKNLKSIYLSGTDNSDFLKIAWKFEHLNEIFIEGNLKRIPRKISKCKKLEKIKIYSINDLIKIKALSRSICKIKSLKNIMLVYVPIKKLPQNIGKLSNLEHITIMESSLQELPKSFYKLNNLKTCCFFSQELNEYTLNSETIKKVKAMLPNCQFDCKY